MRDEDTIRHCMMSFALMGGMLVTSKPKSGRVESAPKRDFLPFLPRRPRAD